MIKWKQYDISVLIMSHTEPALHSKASVAVNCWDVLCCYSHIALHCDIT